MATRKTTTDITEQMRRLYEAARDLKGVTGKSAVANLLNVAAQTLNNFERGRPISNEVLLAAQEKIGCDAIWLRDGVGIMSLSTISKEALDFAIKYEKLDPESRKKLDQIYMLVRPAAPDERVLERFGNVPTEKIRSPER